MAASFKVLPASLGDNGDIDPKLHPKAAELREGVRRIAEARRRSLNGTCRTPAGRASVDSGRESPDT